MSKWLETVANKKWGVEWGGTTMLNESGIDWNSLKVGDKVIITGNVAKDAEKRLLMQK